MSIDFNHLKKVFFEECQDLLSASEEHLNQIADGSFTIDDVHAVFRSVHSIKGGAGSFGFNDLIGFAHVLETLLDNLREEKISLTQEIGDLLFRANDILADFVKEAENQSGNIPTNAEQVKNQLESIVGVDSSKDETREETQKGMQSFEISFLPHQALMQFGNEPLLILRELKTFSCSAEDFELSCDLSKLPSLHELHTDLCYLSWQIKLHSEKSLEILTSVFEFVEDDCDIEIKNQEITPENMDQSNTEAPQTSNPATETKPKAGQAATSEERVQSIRVDLDRIDILVNTVGEMVIKQAMVLDRAQALDLNGDGNNDLVKGLQELTQHTRDLQESVMAIRAQPVKAVFSRVPRLVRELSTELGKEIQIIMHGENTEIDKTVIEKLGEPLTHMIRNAIDHGIEMPDVREKEGKPRQGTIHLLAEHRSGRIVIEILDDGQGINRKRVIEKALKNKLFTEEKIETLSGEEIDNLIFHPGFSTAQEVTNISGRGVGMDVVKRSIQSLGGRVHITSQEGSGCTFTMTLPLTLAVLDGMIVRCVDENYVLPIISIVETVKPKPEQVTKVIGLHDILHLRGENIPLIYLHDVFSINGGVSSAANGIVVVVETEGGERVGLVVDELLNQQQVVIKSLEANYDPIEGISAATILGNGNVALILDVNALKHIKPKPNKVKSSPSKKVESVA